MSTAPPAAVGDRLLDGLNEAQRRAVTTPSSPLCVLAGAGSGKTRVLTRRIAYRIATADALPGHVLALTFTRKAAGELHGRLTQLGIRDRLAAGTFHGTAYTQLRRYWSDRDLEPPTLLERKVRLLMGVTPRGAARGSIEASDLAAEIEWAKARMIGPEQYPGEAEGAGRRPPLAPSLMAEVFARYEEEKNRRRMVDFDDLLALCARALEEDTSFAAAQRWRFRHLFVDEFQDVNPSQYRLLRAWLGDRSDLCVVGDPNQAIYSWNGADPTLLTDFTRRHPGAEVVRLEENYRSSPQVLTVAAAVLGQRPLRANRSDGPIPTIRSYPDEQAEARAVARLVREARRPGSPWSAIAVLTRTNAQLPVFERALRTLQVPSQLAGGGSFLDQPELRPALHRLQSAGMAFPAALRELEDRAREDEAPQDGSSVEEHRLALASLVQLAREYAELDSTPSGAGFGAWLATTMGSDSATGREAVVLSTFHRAKGLEWPVVFMAGLERGLVPIGRNTDPATEAEERRLVYVAVTRAELTLHCSWAERRTFGAKTLSRHPSPYLEEMGHAIDTLSGRTRGVDHGPGLRQARDRLGKARPGTAQSPEADPALLVALRKWRSATARASGVPAYVIFHDSTLAALAANAPRTAQQLLGLPGLGPVKVSRYGGELLALVAEHGRTA